MAKKKNYQTYLIETLKDPGEAIGYLNTALEDGDISVFLLALYNVLQVRIDNNMYTSVSGFIRESLCLLHVYEDLLAKVSRI